MKNLLILALALVATGLFADPQADSLMKKSLGLPSPQDLTATSTMTITDRNGVVKVRKMAEVSKETAEGTKSFSEFLEPADVNGTKFLTVSKKGSDTDQRIYLPALKKVRKISSSGKDGDFMGSDLNYFDMEKHEFEDAAYTLASAEETLDLPAAQGLKLAKVVSTPTEKGAPYSKTITWIDANTGLSYKTECYDKNGSLLKVITIDAYKTIKTFNFPVKTTVKNIQKGSTTVMTLENIVVESGVKDSDVSVKRLEQ
jgi:hypothetical protein